MKAIDLSFSALTPQALAGFRADGVELVVPDLWTGGQTPRPTQQNLNLAHAAGFRIAGYIALAPGHPGEWHVDMGKAGIDGQTWTRLSFVAVDCELSGVTLGMIRGAVERVKALGQKPVIYTRRQWWRDNTGDTSEFSTTGVDLWAAQYDDDPNLASVVPFGGWN